MKNKFKNCMATTALSILLLSLAATLYHARFLCISTVFQVLLANIILHIGFTVLEQFESKYLLVELIIKLCYVNFILIFLGFLFDWYSSTPLWVLIIIGISVYLIGGLTDAILLKNDVTYINNTLKQRRKEQNK